MPSQSDNRREINIVVAWLGNPIQLKCEQQLRGADAESQGCALNPKHCLAQVQPLETSPRLSIFQYRLLLM